MSETDLTSTRMPSTGLCEQSARTEQTAEPESTTRLNGLLDVLADLIAEEIISETQNQNGGIDHEDQSRVSN
jgi:hypothetical protein